jgi:hypothetical protein
MNFGGHQFTGFFGVDCYKERFKISAMYGRLLETVRYNSNLPVTASPTKIWIRI